MEDTAPKKQLNIDQAFGYLRSVKDKVVDKIKKSIKDSAKISVAPKGDRIRFIKYSVDLLQKVETEEADMFYRVTGKSRRLYSNIELADLFRKLLMLRAGGYSIKQIAFVLKELPEILEKVEIIAVEAVKKAITNSQARDIPVLGGLN